MNAAMRIRRCEPEDLARVAAFYDEVVLHLERTVNYPRWIYGVYPAEASVREAILRREQYMCLLEGEVAGAYVCSADPQGDYSAGDWAQPLETGQFLVLHALAAAPRLAGRGAGKAMVRSCIRMARAAGYRAVRLDVVPENLPARRLYERMGFSFAGEKDLGRKIGTMRIPERFALYELNF